MSETALTIAEQYPQNKYNLLVPIRTFQELSPLHKLIVNEVSISPNPADKDVYQEKNKEFALTKKALSKLMAAAGIQLVNSKSVPTQKCNKCIEVAQRTRMAPKCFECPYQDDVAIQVIISIPQLGGTPRFVTATKEIRLDDAKESMSDAQFKSFKPFRTEQCESKALNRALREALHIKSTYPQKELEKPFVVALTVPNWDEPDMKKAAIEMYANNAAALYGTPAPAQISAGQPAAALPEYGNMTVIDDVIDDDPETDYETGEITSNTDVIDVTPGENQELLKDIELPEEIWIGCEGDDCGGVIELFTDASGTQWAPVAWAEYTKKLTGRSLCVKCFLKWQKAQKAAKAAEEKAKKGAEK